MHLKPNGAICLPMLAGAHPKTFETLDGSRQKTTGCKYSLQLVAHILNKGEQMVR
jgi:hypothetical protein